MRFNSLDTSFSLSGEYDSSTDEEAILVTYGYSKDQRPDLKQVLLELMVSQDGGVPFLSQSWKGKANDNQIFWERSRALIEEFKASPKPRYLVADAKLYTQENAQNMANFPFITRIPGTLTSEQQLIEPAWSIDSWQPIDATYSYQRFWLCHYGIKQRWLIIYSKAAEKGAEKTLKKAVATEFSAVQKQLKKLAKKPFSSPSLASSALEEIASVWRYHRLVFSTLTEKRNYAKRGKPTTDTPIKSRTWHIAATVAQDEEKIDQQRRQNACFVLGSNIAENELTDIEVFSAYKGQSAIEQGFSFLKDPVFFVSSLFVKKPSRLQGLLMVMTLALLVYSIAQRRARFALMAYGESIPNQLSRRKPQPSDGFSSF